MSTLKSENGDYNEQSSIEAWRTLNQELFKEEKKWQYEVAEMMDRNERILSTMLGGRNRLSFDNVEGLLRHHIKLGGIKSPDRFQEWLDRLHFCPGWKKHLDKEDRLREVAEDEFREMNIITVNAVTATVDRLYNEVRALSKRDFGLLEKKLRDVKYQRLLKLFESWREE